MIILGLHSDHAIALTIESDGERGVTSMVTSGFEPPCVMQQVECIVMITVFIHSLRDHL